MILLLLILTLLLFIAIFTALSVLLNLAVYYVLDSADIEYTLDLYKFTKRNFLASMVLNILVVCILTDSYGSFKRIWVPASPYIYFIYFIVVTVTSFFNYLFLRKPVPLED